MEKEHQPESMATVAMKPDYAPSEVYSTSEPPPAYRQRLSTSVQIARIVAVTIVLSSFILGFFILASSWVTARAGCQQLDQLDAMLDKELALEGRRYDDLGPLPEELPLKNAHALHFEQTTSTSTTAAPVRVAKTLKDARLTENKSDEDKLQKLDDDNVDDINDDDWESDEEGLDMKSNGIQTKLPVDFDLDDLAGAFLANNDMKGRMNCVVERRRSDPVQSQFPFNLLQAITGKMTGIPVNSERVAIICHAGDEQRQMIPEPQSQVFAFPINGPPQMPIRPAPPAGLQPPASRAPYQAMMPWDLREEDPMMIMSPPHQLRLHVQKIIAMPQPGMNQAEPQRYHPEPNGPPAIMRQFLPQPQLIQVQDNEQSEDPQMQQLPMPIPINLGSLGLSVHDLRAIHRSVQEQEEREQIDNDMQEVKTIVNSLAAAAAASQASEEVPQRQEDDMVEHRSMPVNIPMMMPIEASAPSMMESGEDEVDTPAEKQEHVTTTQDMPEEERPHYVQPRSVRNRRSVPEPLLHREKRVKRCACSCE